MSLSSYLTAFWLGILVSISPCPLATNIAAVSYTARRINDGRGILIEGLFYTLGRIFFYLALTTFFLVSVSSMPIVSHFLQKWFPMIVGPVLIITGMFLLELLSVNFPELPLKTSLLEKTAKIPYLGSFFLGIIFAASFCPVSAAIYFGSFLPLLAGKSSGLPLAVIFGVATGLVVLIFAIAAALGSKAVSSLFKKTSSIEKVTRIFTGSTLIILGIYLSITTIWNF
ncbi:MAG: sulfite exporter TauE/SafE family protein [Deltaproteobacteria bacterium]|nr:sulfite exporter TauE/SafE family protein [Deltaproteobacteria bacterium]